MKYIKNEKFLAIILILIEVLFLLFQTFYQFLQNDENEHIYNAYMIFLGKTPYLDFFEHHNPLMWYLLSPSYKIYENNINIYYLFRFLMFVCVLTTGIFTYKIAKRLSLSDFYSLLSVCFYFGFYILKITGIQIRPDTPMTLFIIIGLYYLITYITQKDSYKNLTISICCFAISFWLLQKSVAFIIPIIFIMIIFVFIKKIPLYNLISASFLAILSSFLYFYYLYSKNCLDLYYIYNYIANIENTRTYSFFKENSYLFTYKNKIILSCIIICVFSFFINIKQNKKISILSFYSLISFLIITHVMYSADKHYMLPLLPLFSIITVDLLQYITNKTNIEKLLKIPFLCFFIIYQIYSDYNIVKNNPYPFPIHIKINDFITKNSSILDIGCIIQ